jgi:hypothetical protein
MSTQEEARKAAVEQRQHEEHLHQSMLSRAESALETPRSPQIQEEARERMVQERQHEEHVHQTMLSRASAEVGLSDNAAETV